RSATIAIFMLASTMPALSRHLSRQLTARDDILKASALSFEFALTLVQGEQMTKGRLEAFSDGVIAIIITIMVLEMKVPHGDGLGALRPLLPVFLSYVLSFLYVGIYWNNHHHLLHASTVVTGAMLWSNLHLLFWLSLFPFTNGCMGENHFTVFPTALYG